MRDADINHFSVLLEQIVSQNKMVLEAVAGLPTREEFNELRQDVVELKQDVKTIKAAVTATNRDVAELDRRVTRLEAA